MPKKKTEEEIETPAEERAVEAAPADGSSKKGRKAKAAEAPAEEHSVVESVIEAAADVAETVAVAVGRTAGKVAAAIGGGEAAKKKVHKRAEKIGIVASDKMTKTVTVRVDRTVKHPVYRKYVKKRKKFMAHDDLGAKIGDKVKIVETRPLSAKKRWRVVEIIHRAEL
ncbi:MAG: 30S ribosomal protein S17 [Acidobacteria bacterium]|nr:30S ribosomal protein S17 [Acidobacteriota bacterium]